MDDDYIFDKDEALDYILYEEVSEESKEKNNSSGCLSILLTLAVSLSGGLWSLAKYL